MNEQVGFSIYIIYYTLLMLYIFGLVYKMTKKMLIYFPWHQS